MAYTSNHYITDWVEESRALMQPDKVCLSYICLV